MTHAKFHVVATFAADFDLFTPFSIHGSPILHFQYAASNKQPLHVQKGRNYGARTIVEIIATMLFGGACVVYLLREDGGGIFPTEFQ